MNRNLLILLGLSAVGGLAWWYYTKRQAKEGPSGFAPALSDNGVPITGLDENGEAAVLDESTGETRVIPWGGPGQWDVAGTGQVVVTTTRTPEQQAQYEAEMRQSCAYNSYLCGLHRTDYACAAMRRCRDEGWL